MTGTVDTLTQMPYNMGVVKGTYMTEEMIMGVVIDICSRTFLLLSDQGDFKTLNCETPNQFMNVLELVKATLEDDQIEYAELAVAG